MNRVILCGRLTRDPEIYENEGANGVFKSAVYSIAVDREHKRENEENADFIRCRCYGKVAEFAEKYLRQGKKMLVEGSWRTGSYEKDGQRVYTNECIVTRHEFVESKSSENAGSSNQNGSTSNESNGDGFYYVPEGVGEDLPFN